MNIKKYSFFLISMLIIGNSTMLSCMDRNLLKPRPQKKSFKSLDIRESNENYYSNFEDDIYLKQDSTKITDTEKLNDNLQVLFPRDKKIDWRSGKNILKLNSPLSNKHTPQQERTMLRREVDLGNVSGVERALNISQKSLNPNIKAKDGLSAVHAAIKFQSAKMVEVLLGDSRVNIFDQTSCNKDLVTKNIFGRHKNNHQHTPDCYQSNLDIAFKREAYDRDNQNAAQRKEIDSIIYDVIQCYYDAGQAGRATLFRWRDENNNNILHRCTQEMLWSSAGLLLSLNKRPDEAPSHYADYIQVILDQFPNYSHVTEAKKQRFLDTLTTFFEKTLIDKAIDDLRNNALGHPLFRRLCKGVRRSLQNLENQNFENKRLTHGSKRTFAGQVLDAVIGFRYLIWLKFKDERTLQNRHYNNYRAARNSQGKDEPLGYDIYTLNNEWRN